MGTGQQQRATSQSRASWSLVLQGQFARLARLNSAAWRAKTLNVCAMQTTLGDTAMKQAAARALAKAAPPLNSPRSAPAVKLKAEQQQQQQLPNLDPEAKPHKHPNGVTMMIVGALVLPGNAVKMTNTPRCLFGPTPRSAVPWDVFRLRARTRAERQVRCSSCPGSMEKVHWRYY